MSHNDLSIRLAPDTSAHDTPAQGNVISALMLRSPRISDFVNRAFNSQSTRGQGIRFLFVGGTSVLVDFLIYRSTLYLTGVVALSKALGFICGTTFSFFSNRAFTFKQKKTEARQILAYLGIYAGTMAVNIAINETILYLLGHNELGINAAFVISAVIAAAINFVGLKLVVF